MRKTLGILICLLILSSCINKNYSVESICDCYSKSEIIKFDQKLNGCLSEFNAELNENKKLNSEELYKAELTKLTKNLISNCEQYQKDFNEILLNKYSNRKTTEIQRNELLEKIDSNENKAVNLIRLSELEIVNGNYEQAEKLINQSIQLDSNIESAYLVKGFLSHKKSDFEQAISDFEIMRKITKSNELKFMADLMILNLKQEMK
jgi:tetratricopeptide (TPR) repeat protein